MEFSEVDVFPADAGMNRGWNRTRFDFTSVPRRRGDEPPTITIMAIRQACSPQTRG